MGDEKRIECWLVVYEDGTVGPFYRESEAHEELARMQPTSPTPLRVVHLVEAPAPVRADALLRRCELAEAACLVLDRELTDAMRLYAGGHDRIQPWVREAVTAIRARESTADAAVQWAREHAKGLASGRDEELEQRVVASQETPPEPRQRTPIVPAEQPASVPVHVEQHDEQWRRDWEREHGAASVSAEQPSAPCATCAITRWGALCSECAESGRWDAYRAKEAEQPSAEPWRTEP